MSVVVEDANQSKQLSIQDDNGARYLIISNDPHILTGPLIRDAIDRITCLPVSRIELYHLKSTDLLFILDDGFDTQT